MEHGGRPGGTATQQAARDLYAHEGHPSPDRADGLAIREARATMAEVMLAASEAQGCAWPNVTSQTKGGGEP